MTCKMKRDDDGKGFMTHDFIEKFCFIDDVNQARWKEKKKECDAKCHRERHKSF